MCIRLETPLSLDNGRRLVKGRVERQDTVRFSCGNVDITPKDPHARRKQGMHAEYDRKPQHARSQVRRLANEPPNLQPASIGRASAGGVRPIERHQLPCKDSTSESPTIRSIAVDVGR